MLWQFSLFGEGGVDPTQIEIPQVTALLVNVANTIMGLIGIVAFIYIIVAGIQYITAAGNAAKQTEAKKAVTAALFGMLIVLLAFFITQEILRRFDFDANIGGSQDIGPLTPGLQPDTSSGESE